MKGLLFFFLITFLSCSSNSITAPASNPAGYDLQKPTIVNLPLELDEISGLSYYAKDKAVFAISDEKGVLYKINPYPDLSIKRWKFSKKSDFEDLVLLDTSFYILQSNGIMHVVKFKNDSLLTAETPFPFQSKMEFETLFYDPVIKKLELICKNCGDEKKKLLNVYSYDPIKNEYSDSASFIDISALFQKSGVKPFHLRPSGAAVHPVTGDIYIISSINKSLLILSKDRSVRSYYPLSPALFKQPEGITFAENGTLIISNESAKTGSANLLIFTYNK